MWTKKQILEPYLDGKTLQEIGDSWNISRERVSQLLKHKFQITKDQKEKHNHNRHRNKRRLYIQKNIEDKFAVYGQNGQGGGNWWEKKVFFLLSEMGFSVIPFTSSSAIDMIVNGWRVDIKGAFKPSMNKNKNGECTGYQFRARKKQLDFVEFFICCMNVNKRDIYYVIPREEWGGVVTNINPFGEKSRYKKYKNAWKQLRFPY